jgi:uncharacterized protein
VTALAPGVYIQEVNTGANVIQAEGTSTAGFAGFAHRSVHVGEAVAINGWREYCRLFANDNQEPTPMALAVYGYFTNGGQRCWIANTGKPDDFGSPNPRSGIHRLEEVDEVAIVVAPGATSPADYDMVLSHCEKLKDRVAILDAPRKVTNISSLTKVGTSSLPAKPGDGDGPTPRSKLDEAYRPRMSAYGTFYFPWIVTQNPFGTARQLVEAAPSGHVAGVWARSDANFGVHKPPANEILRGAVGLTYNLVDAEQAELNSAGVNCIRSFSREGIRVWGARTIDDASSEWRYLNVRRLFCMIEESIAKSTRWAVFRKNDYALWQAIKRDVSGFLRNQWRAGALLGKTPEQAFYVKCDEETNPIESIREGKLVIEIGIAPVRPAEFIIFRIGQHELSTEKEEVASGE